MKIIFAASKTEIKELDAHDVDFSLFFDEPILSCWSIYGNGQLHLDSGDEKISLSVEYMGPNQYFLDWHYDGRMVPYDGSSCDEYRTIEMGGDPFRVPLACTVDTHTAIRALTYSTKYRQRDPQINWELMDNVPFSANWYDG